MSTSYRQILRSSSILGGASVINIVLGLVRTKVVAALLGTAGIGLVGLLQSLMATASEIAQLGVGQAGTRQVAAAASQESPEAIATVRRALFVGTAVMGTLGGVIVWCLREQLATEVLGDVARCGDVGWLALGVALSVFAASQNALINGFQRMGDLAKLSVGSAVVSTIVGVLAISLLGSDGVVLFVVVTPLASFSIASYLVRSMPASTTPVGVIVPWHAVQHELRTLIQLGVAFMVAGAVTTVGQLAVRTLILREVGPDGLGQFQAAWSISMNYIGFVLSAMAGDYYPRLTAAIGDDARVNRLVNEQSEVALLMAGPVLMVILALAPWVIWLLYSAEFAEAAVLLRWQILGDMLKVVGWPLGFIVLASGHGKTFMFTQSLQMGVFTCLVWFGLPLMGVEATGPAFAAMYVVGVAVNYILATWNTSFSWNSHVRWHIAVLVGLGLGVSVLARCSEVAGTVVGLVASVGLTVHSFSRLSHMLELGGRVGRLAVESRRVMIALGVWKD